MIESRSLLLGASILAIGHFCPGSVAQTNEKPSQAQDNYSDDPSYQEARNLLEVFAGAADKRATKEQREPQEGQSTATLKRPRTRFINTRSM